MKKVLIIGLGSIGERHFKILKSFGLTIKIISNRQKYEKYKILKNRESITSFNPDYIIIATKTENHLSDLIFVNKYLKNKIILIEKPLFHKITKFQTKLKNIVVVGFNMRFNPLVSYLKNYFKNYRNLIFSVNLYCGSYLPKWRSNIEYEKSASASKLSGGVLKDLSHEIDYISWIFGDILKYNKLSVKTSNLNIKSHDLAFINGKTKKCYFNISLNYFSYISHRYLIIDCEKETLHVDLINKEIKIKKIDKRLIKKTWNFDRNYSYSSMHKEILKNKLDKLCLFDQGLKYLKF